MQLGVLLAKPWLTQRCIATSQAIDFVQMQGDDELRELLITLALGSPDFTGQSRQQN